MFLIVSLFFNMTVYAAEREEITDITVETVTVSEMLSMQITKMAAECGTDLTVSCVKPLSDFSGNRYFAVEFEPTGYLICHGEYGETLEYAEESPSPYLGMEGDLLYAGPTYYYSLKDEMFSNPIFGEEVCTSDTDYLAALSDASDELDSTISATAELYVDLGEDMSLTATDYTRLEGTTVSPNAAPSMFFIPSLIALRDFSADDISISDVSSSYWGYTAIQYCTRFCLLPLDNERFRPEDDATRLEFVVALHGLAGKPDPVSDTISARFVDAPSKQADLANFNAAQWAFENGILTGTSSNTLELDDSLTREQAAVFFFRYATYLGFNFSITSGPAYTTFDDYRTVSPFARSGVDWATKRYLLRGDRGLLYPKRNLTNAETAQLIYNLTIRASR